jgi:pimeloyl-ACP methyl ester carboxylesterase
MPALNAFRSFVFCLTLLPLTFSASVRADGERDNDPTSVRRIPREGIDVPADREAALREKLTALQQRISELAQKKDSESQALLPDVQIFERAVRCALDYNEFFSPKDVDKADALLDEGLARATQLAEGQPLWPQQTGLVVRGYVSKIDHTVQPYGLVIPATYAMDHSVATRCDLWFHGRGETLSEVNFIWDRMKNAGRYTPDHTIVLHPYGRYSNAFKFAGETDVLEALADVQQRYRIDEDRISVRGFSMGGAACWQFAVHYADRWFAANPGAGFSETPLFLDFFQKETLNPKPWEKQLWNLYDCNHVAVNLAHCPTIAYSGEKDIQKQAADVMATALERRGMRLKHIIGPDMGHTIDAESRRIIDRDLAALAKHGRQTLPRTIQFETYTLKYNRLHWLTLEALEEHWKEARVVCRWDDDDQVSVACANVRQLSLNFPPGTFQAAQLTKPKYQVFINAPRRSAITVPGPLSDGSWTVRIRQGDRGQWRAVAEDEHNVLSKRHGLQGPIDDALMDSFVFVRPTGKANHDAVDKWTKAELDRAIVHWRRHFRGDARVINDTELTDELIQSANLVLWGDASSNAVINRVLPKLPIQWTADQLQVGEDTYTASEHAPVLIYPNPLNPNRYVVLNSSFTYRDYAYLNNARQVPMLPDWAVINLKTPPGNVWPGEVVAADFFDESWQLK